MTYRKDSIFLDDALDLVKSAFYNELQRQHIDSKTVSRRTFEMISSDISDDPYLRMDVKRSERLVKKVLDGLGMTIKD